MLDIFRQKRQSWIVIGLFGIIILVFVFFGVGPQGGGQRSSGVAATVNGDEISSEEYRNFYNNQLEYYRRTFKEKFTPEMLESLDLRKRTIDALISQRLVLQAALKGGVTVSTEEVRGTIAQIPAFQKDGVFDKETYITLLSSNRMKPGDFEKRLEYDLISEKMRASVVADVTVTDDEVRERFFNDNRSVDYKYMEIDPAMFREGISVTDDDGRKYLEENGADFLTPTKIKVYYSYIDLEEVGKGVTISDEAIEGYYNANSADFEVGEEVKASHILIKTEGDVDEEAKKRAIEVLGKVQGGGDFGALAREYSQDPGSGSRGGDLGWFGRGRMIKEFEDSAFSLEVGEISPLIKTVYGFHIIKVEAKREARLEALEAVKGKIEDELKRVESERLARENGAKLVQPFNAAATVEELDEMAKAQGVEGTATDLFGVEDTNELTYNKNISEILFTMSEGEVRGPIETGEGIFVAKVVERVEEHIPTYEMISDVIKQVIIDEGAALAAKKRGEEIIAELKGGGDFTSIAKGGGFKLGTTGQFTKREGFIAKIGAFVQDEESLFTRSEDAPYHDDPLLGGSRYYVFKFLSSKEVAEDAFSDSKESLKASIIQDKQEKRLMEWLEAEREKAEITLNEEVL